MKGSAVVYRVPRSEGWRVLTGIIINATRYGVVVQEQRSGISSTINPNWVIAIGVPEKQTAVTEVTAVA